MKSIPGVSVDPIIRPFAILRLLPPTSLRPHPPSQHIRPIRHSSRIAQFVPLFRIIRIIRISAIRVQLLSAHIALPAIPVNLALLPNPLNHLTAITIIPFTAASINSRNNSITKTNLIQMLRNRIFYFISFHWDLLQGFNN
jgi:hypothetical protein